MSKTALMFFGILLKYVLGFTGITVTLTLFATGVVKNDKAQLKKAAITFVSTWVALVLIRPLEFWILENPLFK